MRQVVVKVACFLFPFWKHYREFLSSQTCHIPFIQWALFWLKKDKKVFWPTYKDVELTHPNNIHVGINSQVGLRPGNYIQGNGGLFIGSYVAITSNCGIISGNHDPLDHSKHIDKEVRIEDHCWIGMNSMILPGVHLGPRTVVGAGSVVTKSFPEGYCIIAGNPAKLIKYLDRDRFSPQKLPREYYGYIPKEKFEKFAKKHLKDNKYYQDYINEINKLS